MLLSRLILYKNVPYESLLALVAKQVLVNLHNNVRVIRLDDSMQQRLYFLHILMELRIRSLKPHKLLTIRKHLGEIDLLQDQAFSLAYLSNYLKTQHNHLGGLFGTLNLLMIQNNVEQNTQKNSWVVIDDCLE